MTYTMLVEVLDGGENLLKELRGLRLTKLLGLDDPVEQLAAGAELHYNVDISIVDISLVKLNYVRMIESLQNCQF